MQYLGLFLLLALTGGLGFILFSPLLKGWRTQIFGYLTIGAGGLSLPAPLHASCRDCSRSPDGS
jgi:hypothetical protein